LTLGTTDANYKGFVALEDHLVARPYSRVLAQELRALELDVDQAVQSKRWNS